MSEMDWDQSEDNAAEVQNSDGMAQLRKAFERQKKQNEELRANLADLTAKDRERALSEVITSKGLNAKIAGFYPPGADATVDAVDKWLTDNADVFGLTAAEERSQETVVPEEIREQFAQFSKLSGGERPNQSLTEQVKGFKMENDADYNSFITFMRNNPNAVQNPHA